MKFKRLFTKVSKFECVLFLMFFLFSWGLMWKTFQLDPNGDIMIASKAWSDFAATIPLVRSFSFGSNWPPEYPIFSGQPIRYHFVFFAFVGFLEKIGFPLSWALNIPSIFGFTMLLVSIYYLGKVVFKSTAVGALSSIFFLFNGSLSFLEFIKNHTFSIESLEALISSTTFNSFGPYDGKIVSAFWNLNIYTNQRHLAFAYAVFILILIYLYKKSVTKMELNFKAAISIGILIGSFPFIHQAVYGMMGILIITFFLIFPKMRKGLFLTGCISLLMGLPQFLYMSVEGVSKLSLLDPGYLITNLSTTNFIKYWFFNLGLILIITPIGFLKSNKDQRKILVPFILLFIVGNLFRFGPDIATNHKFFNLFIIGANLFAAYCVVTMWKSGVFAKSLAVWSFVFLTLSGVMDIFPVINDLHIKISDVPNNKMASYIASNTPKKSVFLNSSYLFHPASVAGRKILMGWPYFAWSAGYNTEARNLLMKQMFTSQPKSETCRLLFQNKIDYFTIQDTTNDSDFVYIDLDYFKNNFTIEYSDQGTSLINVSQNCYS